jgi:hypothetical protein
MPTTKKKAAKPARRRVRRRNGGGTIAQLKKWIEKDFGRKFAHITRTVERPRKAITFMMWGPTMTYTITAWERGAKLPRGDGPEEYDGIMASCSQRFYQDGEDWHRGLDLSDGPLEKGTWDRISAEIRHHAIHTLPPVKETDWIFFTKGTAKDIARLGLKMTFTPTLESEERRERIRGRVLKKKLSKKFGGKKKSAKHTPQKRTR